MYACLLKTRQSQTSTASLSLRHAGLRSPSISIIEAPRSVQSGGVPLMSTRVTPGVCTAEREMPL